MKTAQIYNAYKRERKRGYKKADLYIKKSEWWEEC